MIKMCLSLGIMAIGKRILIGNLIAYGRDKEMIMYQNRVTIISQNETVSGPIQELLLENGLEVNTVKSIEMSL